MRRNAYHLAIPGACALLAVMLIGGTRATVRAPKPTVTAARSAKPAASAARPADTFLASSVAVTETVLSPAKQPELLRNAAPARAAKLAKFRVVPMEVTAYCPCRKCCGPDAAGITASGKLVSHNNGFFVAAPGSIPFQTKLIIPGYAGGREVPVLDRGGAIKEGKLDVFFPTHGQALQWGRRKILVTIVD